MAFKILSAKFILRTAIRILGLLSFLKTHSLIYLSSFYIFTVIFFGIVIKKTTTKRILLDLNQIYIFF
jgi:hypothetical protein